MAFTPSTPMLVWPKYRSVSGALKNPIEGANRRVSGRKEQHLKALDERYGSKDYYASYLGSAAAMAPAPSTPIELKLMFKLFNGALTK